jgi:hypothetical protein
MADRIYNVDLRRSSTAEMALRLIVLFTILIISIGLSRMWSGGSWVIDLFALAIAIAALAILPKRAGKTVRMSPPELREWVMAGCPDTWGKEG